MQTTHKYTCLLSLPPGIATAAGLLGRGIPGPPQEEALRLPWRHREPREGAEGAGDVQVPLLFVWDNHP